MTDPRTAYNEGYDGPDPDAHADMSNPSNQRIFDDQVSGGKVIEPDPVAHSVEAMKILREHGVQAYLAYLRR